MKRYLASKAAQLVVVMIVVSIFSFAIIYVAPGDISSMYITPDMTDEQKDAVNADLGLDKSLPEQYLAWAERAIQGDFGVSLTNKSAVMPQIINRLPATLLLMGSSLLLAVVVAVPLGLAAGLKKSKWADKLISGLTYIGMSVPSFWLGMMLIIVFSATFSLLPSSGMHRVGDQSFGDLMAHLVMPCITLAIASMAVFVRYIRGNTIRELGEDYVLTAAAKGTPRRKILTRHVLKNTLLPIITLLGMRIPSLVCGSFIIESVFGWPGIGMLAMSAIGARDYPVIMAYVMMTGLIMVIGNFIADLLYAAADPRIREWSGRNHG